MKFNPHLLTPLAVVSGSILQSQHPIQSSEFGLETTTTRTAVPGDSPAFYCSDSDPKDNLYQMEALFMTPNPPRLDEYVTITVWGNFPDLAVTGPNPTINFKAGLEDIDGEFQLCNSHQLDVYQGPPYWRGGGRSCPPTHEWSEITYSFHYFSEIGGDRRRNVTTRAGFLTTDKKRLFCVEGWFREDSFWHFDTGID